MLLIIMTSFKDLYTILHYFIPAFSIISVHDDTADAICEETSQKGEFLLQLTLKHWCFLHQCLRL